MAVYGAWRVLSAAPDEVSLEAVVASLEDKDSPESSSSTAISEDFEAEVDSEEKASSSDDGVWYVDSNSGSFTFDDSSGSFVGFRVEEELAQIGSMTAVGRTGDVEGQLVIENGELVEVAVSADLSTIVTNDSRRDRAARHALNVREHPMATFVLEESASSGQDRSPASRRHDRGSGFDRRYVYRLRRCRSFGHNRSFGGRPRDR